ncbi:MAG: hypothetical protein ABII01_06635, partial [Candidatus Woesearchaeota archaeon]
AQIVMGEGKKEYRKNTRPTTKQQNNTLIFLKTKESQVITTHTIGDTDKNERFIYLNTHPCFKVNFKIS